VLAPRKEIYAVGRTKTEARRVEHPQLEQGLDEFWRKNICPILRKKCELDREGVADFKREYRKLCRRPGFELLKRRHPADAVQWYLEVGARGLTWTW
jgi:hypothetical protein